MVNVFEMISFRYYRKAAVVAITTAKIATELALNSAHLAHRTLV